MRQSANKPGQHADAAEESTSAPRDEEYLLTEDEAAMAAALALMTGFSQGCCPAHRSPMAAKVAVQLGYMAEGTVSSDMRAFLRRLQQRWNAVAEELKPQESALPGNSHPNAHPHEISTPHALWHAPLETLQ